MSDGYSILHQPWWWDATALRGWDQAEVAVDGRIVARWPFTRMKSPPGLALLSSPPLTNRAGPWIAPMEGKQATQYSRTATLLQQLIADLPRHNWIAQNLHADFGYWLPLYWNGFRIEARATYVLADCRDTDALEANLDEASRRQIKKGRRNLVINEISADRLIDLIRKTFRRQGHGMRVSPTVLESVMEAIRCRDAGRAVAAVDGQGRLHAAALFVWDDRTMYYLVGGGDPELRSSGAGTYVLWEGLCDASRRGLAFDFEGSMIPNVERFFRGFGAEQRNILQVTKGSPLVRAGYQLAKWLRK